MKFLRVTDNQDGYILLIRPDTITSIKCFTKDGVTSFINTLTGETYRDTFYVRESEEEILRQLEKEDDGD